MVCNLIFIHIGVACWIWFIWLLAMQYELWVIIVEWKCDTFSWQFGGARGEDGATKHHVIYHKYHFPFSSSFPKLSSLMRIPHHPSPPGHHRHHHRQRRHHYLPLRCIAHFHCTAFIKIVVHENGRKFFCTKCKIATLTLIKIRVVYWRYWHFHQKICPYSSIHCWFSTIIFRSRFLDIPRIPAYLTT